MLLILNSWKESSRRGVTKTKTYENEDLRPKTPSSFSLYENEDPRILRPADTKTPEY